MGSGRDKRKKAKGGGKPGAGAEKTARKSEQNEGKAVRRLERKTQGGEDDIDALLAKFKLEDAAATAIRVEPGVRPSPRVYSTFNLLPSQQKENELILFGGEWYDSEKDKTHVYADLFVLDVEKVAWRRIVSPKGPLPRSSHQSVMTKYHMYVFGGEFTSLNQEKFRHYNDLWRLNLADWSWEQLPGRGGPSPRSGHRMVLQRNRLLLFGGFWDAGKEPKYYNDLWAFHLTDLQWECLGPTTQTGSSWPSPRGGCQLAVHGELLFVFGGYSVLPPPDKDPAAKAAKRKSAGDDDDEGGKGVVHDDVWCYDTKSGAWERVRKAGMAPSARTGFGMARHGRRAVYFGGVVDQAGGRDRVYSELFNEAYQFDLETRRWFPLAVTPAQRARLEAAATCIQASFRGYAVRKAYTAYKLGGAVSELLYSPALYGVDVGASADTVAHTDVVLDDVWSLDLSKLDGWTCVQENTGGEELKDLSDWESDEEDSDSEAE
ncbi:Kelch domain-containing protein 4 [Auxenochlorella protothecoides]|uniref:Kelch domain-containing protein 4 n=1 Tax=Auxenochlorella protothecoides TaxID=3075 RepID=A0A087SC89_AUXPR|nr:Kelch domain-containing protein 4 [Auxenochlorella protothecoides]KFM23343.1 Kelch domain-containing protein 4 [Auxenochlorella protothecoides]